ncbi:MAG: alpha/beta fold hydrolase [Pseudomonas sp.]|uniref:alpha/beta fold hydrolase n=1 Tax=Pseudomonas sp. TaxID=306 RepID=UPI003D0D4088
MKPAIAVVNVHGVYNIHTEFYANPSANKTIILVNGSLATTAAFAQTVRYLSEQFNVVLYDQPYAGQSKPHNQHYAPIRKEDEASILLELIEHFKADHLMSFSWGGVAAMLALAKRPPRIERAIITSFSPTLNNAMIDYLEEGLLHLDTLDGDRLGHLVNGTIGKHLPSLFKRFNHRHISRLDHHEYRQMYAHVHQVLHLDAHCEMECLAAVDIPVLFINGEHDEYTSYEDARLFSSYLSNCQFASIDNAGHFLDMEHKAAWHQCRSVLQRFMQGTTTRERTYRTQVELQHAMAV